MDTLSTPDGVVEGTDLVVLDCTVTIEATEDGGVAASGSAFVMTRMGFTDVAVYTASLQEWASDPANPMEVVDDTP